MQTSGEANRSVPQCRPQNGHLPYPCGSVNSKQWSVISQKPTSSIPESLNSSIPQFLNYSIKSFGPAKRQREAAIETAIETATRSGKMQKDSDEWWVRNDDGGWNFLPPYSVFRSLYGADMSGTGPTRYTVKMSWPGTTSLALGIRSWRQRARNRGRNGFAESVISDTYRVRLFEYFYNDKFFTWSDPTLTPVLAILKKLIIW